MKIVLTGFMATGKTSTAIALSEKLGLPVVDTDELIVKQEGMSIAQIFEEKGEPYFREVERTIIDQVSRLADAIIAPGGGAIKDKRNMKALKSNGLMVCLAAQPEEILRRVQQEAGVRPLLNVPNPLEKIQSLLKERAPLYRQADLTIDTTSIAPLEAAEQIICQAKLDAEVVNAGDSNQTYPILIAPNLIPFSGIRIKPFRPSQIAIVSNPTVYGLYGGLLAHSLQKEGIAYHTILLPNGEAYKNLNWAWYLLGELIKMGFDKNGMCVALGGGVICDIAGFVASIYLGGVRFALMPTTLLAQTDCSVGGKTQLNHAFGYNYIAANRRPSFVVIDVNTLCSLSEREISAGMTQPIKRGIVADAELFEHIESYKGRTMNDSVLVDMIRRSCLITDSVVNAQSDEQPLTINDFGHEIGHAIFSIGRDKKLLYGEAIAMGMRASARLATKVKLLPADDEKRIVDLLAAYGLPIAIAPDISIDAIMQGLLKHSQLFSNRLCMVLPEAIGKATIVEGLNPDVVKDALTSINNA
jgi:3-dehydroquinate synthetase